MNFTKFAYFVTILNKIEINREKGFATWRALIRRYLFARIRSSGRQILITMDGRDLFSWSSLVRRLAAMSATRAAASGGVLAVHFWLRSGGRGVANVRDPGGVLDGNFAFLLRRLRANGGGERLSESDDKLRLLWCS
jgi:hypothetical protein